MNDNIEKAKNVLQVKERSYLDFDAATDSLKLGRRREEQRLHLHVHDQRFELGRITSAFPLSAKFERIVLFNTDGKEIGFLKNASHLDQGSLQLLQEELDMAYFMPVIEAIEEISDHLGLELWRVRTNRGERSFEVRLPRKNVRIIGPKRLIVKDVDGNRYEIEDWHTLDKKSLSLLMRHL